METITMKRLLPLVPGVLLFSLAAVAACRQAPAPAAPAAAAEFRPTATVQDLMLHMVDPNADVLWESVATIVNAKGIDERQPKTDEEWAAVRNAAITLLEATNLLLIDRPVAKSGVKSENPGIELGPEEIDAIRKKDPEAWIKYAHGLHDTVMPALKAIDAKDATALQNAGAEIDTACENCHLHYWYPNDKRPS
jgi:hypothetical protein